MTRFAFIISLYGIAAAEAAAAEQAISLKSAGTQISPQRQAALYLPIEDVLTTFTRKVGISFIFDSRLIRGKTVLLPNETSAPEVALKESLHTANLELHKVSATTYAITAQASPPGVSAAPIPIPVANASSSTLIDTIVVTASAASALAEAGSRNLFVFDRQSLDYLAVVNPAEAIFELPQSLASITAANTSFLGASAGLNLADLRGLGPERTMVLVNGRRRTAVSGGNGSIAGFDLSAVAEPFLERVEISNQFGGARFGTEAVAGAINFVTPTGMESFEAGVRYGVSERGDAEEFSAHALGGLSLFDGAGNVTLGLNHVRENGLLGADRALTAEPYGFAVNGFASTADNAEFLPGFGGSSITPDGQLAGVLTTDGNFLPAMFVTGSTVLTGANTVAPYERSADQLFNWLAPTNTIIPIDRTLGLIDASLDITPSVKLFAEAHIGLSQIRSQIAAVPAGSFQGFDPIIGDAVPISLTDPTVPLAIQQFAQNAFGPDVSSLVISRRYTEVGPRRRNVDRRYNEMIAGAEINLGENSQFQTFYRYGRNTSYTDQTNRIDRNRLLLSVDTNLCEQTPGCSPINLFETGGISQTAANFFRAPAISRKLNIMEHEISGHFKTTIAPQSIRKTDINIGASLRRTKLMDQDTTPGNIEVIGTFIDNDFEGALNVAEFHGSLDTQILNDKSPIGAIDLSLLYRITASSQFNTAHNFESGLNWRPANGVSIFGAYGTGNRTPTVTELFFVDRSTEGFFTDPCVRDDVRFVENCNSDAALAVSDGFSQTKFLALQSVFGNPDLGLEDIESTRAGIVVQPDEWSAAFPGRLHLSASWLTYHIDNAVGRPSNALEECFSSENFSSAACGVSPVSGRPLIERDPVTEQIVSIGAVLQNQESRSWRGLDLEARYAFEPQGLGSIDRIWVSGLHTYTHKVEKTPIGGAPIDETGLAAYPRHQTLLSAGASSGPVSISAFAQRRGQAVTRRSSVAETRLPVVTTFDLTAKIDLDDRAVATIAIENLTDREAPLVAFGGGPNTLPQYYDIIGRRFSVGLKASF